jgi:ADP-ribose pyrophosphatase YjhB (NUDIX family)
MRVSEAALAWIQHLGPTGPELLVQWSESWQMFSLIGGHRETGETFRDCCIREIAEELELTPDQYTVAPQPLRRVEYVAYSHSQQRETCYQIELFQASGIDWDTAVRIPQTRWIRGDEVYARKTHDGLPISDQVAHMVKAAIAAEG